MLPPNQAVETDAQGRPRLSALLSLVAAHFYVGHHSKPLAENNQHVESRIGPIWHMEAAFL